jgi:hypothetical protein
MSEELTTGKKECTSLYGNLKSTGTKMKPNRNKTEQCLKTGSKLLFYFFDLWKPVVFRAVNM